jgi:uncharacterized protein YbgA (DUF1722 family)/uncharacterized protein YbbK (DUF523 family)
LGEKVRYDGQHKHDHFLTDTLGPYVEYVPVCPEVESGFPIPREAFRLVGDPDAPRLVTQKTEKDCTGIMQRWAQKRLRQLAQENLAGFVFKSKSPSSGMERVKVYPANGGPAVRKGVGIFARMFMDRFPLLPVEEEGRLHDADLRENFIERIFVMKRWQEMTGASRSRKALVDFHTRHKYLVMSHSSDHLRKLGRLVSKQTELKETDLREQYVMLLMEALQRRATIRKHVNVLQHMMGYFKKTLSHDEKAEMLEVIQSYHKGYVPLIVPVTLINHYVRKYQEPYLAEQFYLNPHPLELKLRNHA